MAQCIHLFLATLVRANLICWRLGLWTGDPRALRRHKTRLRLPKLIEVIHEIPELFLLPRCSSAATEFLFVDEADPFALLYVWQADAGRFEFQGSLLLRSALVLLISCRIGFNTTLVLEGPPRDASLASNRVACLTSVLHLGGVDLLLVIHGALESSIFDHRGQLVLTVVQVGSCLQIRLMLPQSLV